MKLNKHLILFIVLLSCVNVCKAQKGNHESDSLQYEMLWNNDSLGFFGRGWLFDSLKEKYRLLSNNMDSITKVLGNPNESDTTETHFVFTYWFNCFGSIQLDSTLTKIIKEEHMEGTDCCYIQLYIRKKTRNFEFYTKKCIAIN